MRWGSLALPFGAQRSEKLEMILSDVDVLR